MINIWFTIAAVLTVLIGVVHSLLGEKFIIGPLQRRRDLPIIFGSDKHTKRTLRFAWHLTTLAGFGLAGIMFLLAFSESLSVRLVTTVLCSTFASSFVLSLVGTRAKHFSWFVFLVIVILLLLGLRF